MRGGIIHDMNVIFFVTKGKLSFEVVFSHFWYLCVGSYNSSKHLKGKLWNLSSGTALGLDLLSPLKSRYQLCCVAKKNWLSFQLGKTRTKVLDLRFLPGRSVWSRGIRSSAQATWITCLAFCPGSAAACIGYFPRLNCEYRVGYMRKLTKVKALEQDLVCFAKFDKFMETKINFRIRLCLAMDKWKKIALFFIFYQIGLICIYIMIFGKINLLLYPPIGLVFFINSIFFASWGSPLLGHTRREAIYLLLSSLKILQHTLSKMKSIILCLIHGVFMHNLKRRMNEIYIWKLWPARPNKEHRYVGRHFKTMRSLWLVENLKKW